MALVHNNYPATNASPGTTIMETSVRMTTATTPSGGSRLAQMQARFQQKQLQEKEQKLLRLYESQQQRAFQRVAPRGSAGSSSNNSVSSNTSSTYSVGKVRQMFDERRSNGSTGWDRSYPLEPLDASLNKSRTAPLPSINKTKANRVASLDRSQNNYNQQVSKTNVKRSKSQVRGGVSTELNGSYRKQNSVDSDYNSSFRRLTVEEEHNGSYRKLNNTQRFAESFRVQPEEENLCDGYRNDRIDDYDGNYRKENNTETLNGSLRKQELNNSRVYQKDNYETINFDEEEDQQFNGNKTFTVIDDSNREDLFAKYQVRDVENNELLSASPPPELYNDDELDDSFVFKKLPNVGGPLLLDETTAAKNSDKFKTYNASKQNKKMPPPAAAEVKKGARGTVRRESASPPPKAPSKTTPRKSENKVVSPPAGVRRPAATPLVKQNSSPQPKTTTSSSTNMQKSSSKKIGVVASQPQPTSSQTKMKSGTRRTGVASAQDGLAECHICQRRFAADRIEKHETICRRTSSKKRKVFDATKHRVMGTEAEAYVKNLSKQKSEIKTKSKKDDWRKKHEDFIMTIRAAKEAQAHVKAGGSLRDLPPPPPLDTSDYIQCPHCSRKFNEGAAERHIPRCATMLHNKPKPIAAGTKKR